MPPEILVMNNVFRSWRLEGTVENSPEGAQCTCQVYLGRMDRNSPLGTGTTTSYPYPPMAPPRASRHTHRLAQVPPWLSPQPKYLAGGAHIHPHPHPSNTTPWPRLRPALAPPRAPGPAHRPAHLSPRSFSRCTPDLGELPRWCVPSSSRESDLCVGAVKKSSSSWERLVKCRASLCVWLTIHLGTSLFWQQSETVWL